MRGSEGEADDTAGTGSTDDGGDPDGRHRAGRDGADEGTDWHARPAEDVREALGTGPEGLDAATAEERLAEYGPNELERGEGPSPLRVFLSQFTDALVVLLFAAAVLSLAVGLFPGEEPEYVDAALILAILLGNGLFGFVQDYRAERSIDALRELATPDATVVRDGTPTDVPATEVVPGDLVVLEEGDQVPADCRLVETAGMETDEAALTGESASVAKDPAAVDADAPLAERTDMVYSNTTVVRGRGRGVVVATGMTTEVGAIATSLSTTEDPPTPFEREVARLGRRIGTGVLALIAFVAAVQFLFTDAAPLTVGLGAVTLAVAAVPEGLPAVVTLTLALGSRKLLARNALVRNLKVVESLGAVDVIVTDKTGTLTESEMTVQRVTVGHAVYDVGGVGADGGAPDGGGTDAAEVVRTAGEDGSGSSDDPVDVAAVEPVLRAGAVCNDAERLPDGTYRGDPTEVALRRVADDLGVPADHERLREVPFDSERKRMTVVAAEEEPTAYVKGAPGVVLERCTRILDDGEVRELTDADRERIRERLTAFGGDALRVLALARTVGVDPEADPEELESDLTFLGLQGMLDPPRPEVPGAVADCRAAGIRVVMATGDSPETARAVGEMVGFDADEVCTGADLDRMDDAELDAAVREVDVFARVSPGHKVRVLQALQATGASVAMTGDGVNDAPALRSADVGVSMGQRGTDVARGAADMVLQDDDFATIRDAVAEGRGVFDNVRKFVNYLLTANAGEVLVVLFGVVLGTVLFPEAFAGAEEALVLTPAMLLWLNLVTDGFPALALGADARADDVMARPPRGADDPVIDREMLVAIVGVGFAMTVAGLGVFFAGLDRTGDLAFAQTALFTFLVTVELVRIQVIRSRYDQSLLSNPWLVGAVSLSLALQLAVLYSPLNDLFEVIPLGVDGWTLVGGGFLAFLAMNVVLVALLERTGGWDRVD